MIESIPTEIARSRSWIFVDAGPSICGLPFLMVHEVPSSPRFAGYEYEDGHVSAMAIQWRGKGERRMWHDSPDGRDDLEVRRPLAVLFDVGEDKRESDNDEQVHDDAV